jgi:hypothetical protein
MRTMQRGAVTVGLVLVAVGCGGDQVAERIAENRIESAGGGDVDVDLNDGEFSVKTEDGEFSIKTDEDGNVSIQGSGSNDGETFTIESENGETVVESDGGTATFSQGTDLPEGFPDDIPIPDSMTVVFSQAAETPEGQAFSIVATSPLGVDELVEQMTSGLESGGYEQQQLTTTPDGAVMVYQQSDRAVTVAIGGGDVDETSITMTVTPGA